jgi:hypothetical protein
MTPGMAGHKERVPTVPASPSVGQERHLQAV